MPDIAASLARTDGMPRPFVLQRNEDLTGVSGTGIVAWGVQFPDGIVALRWNSAWPTSVVFHDKGIEAVRAIHGHDGRTEIVWGDYVPSDQWPRLAWKAVVEGVLGHGETQENTRYIVHRLTPDNPSPPRDVS